jgi:membrane-associated protein
MDFIHWFIDFVLHIDKHLVEIVANYQTWTYLILFLIVFCETGLVVTPFLPGDSLIFASGALAAANGSPLIVYVLILIFFSAAFGGDNTNYWLGRFLGTKVYEKNYKLISRKNLDKTHAFYEKHGGKTLIFARFMPIIRTFAPFVAGVGKMRYLRFLSFSFISNVLWVNFFCWFGYLFANQPWVKNHFSIVVLTIIILSLMPPVFTLLREYFRKKK